MAQDSDLPKPAAAADKGKGKAVDDPKAEKTAADGKKEDDKKDGNTWRPDTPPLLGIASVSMADLMGSSDRRRAQRRGPAAQERAGHDGRAFNSEYSRFTNRREEGDEERTKEGQLLLWDEE